MRPPNSQVLAPVLALFAASCGFENPYADNEKGCKYNCSKGNDDSKKLKDSERDHPRSTATIPTDSAFWLNVITNNNVEGKLGSSSKAAEEYFNLLSSSPLALSDGPTSITGILGKIRSDINNVVALAGKTVPQKETESCLIDKFKAAATPGDGTTALTVDYGKCIPLNNLTERTNDGYIAFTEYEAAIQLNTNMGTGILNTGLDLGKVFPLNTALQSLSLGGVSEAQFYLSKAIVQTSVDIVNKKVKSAFRDWAFFSLGAGPEKPFRVAFDPLQHRLTLNGDLFSLGATIVNPASSESFGGEAAQGDYIQIRFKDFAMTNETDSGTFAFNRDAVLTGSYLVFVNGTLFELTGQNKKCEMLGTMLQSGKDPAPIGTISLCH